LTAAPAPRGFQSAARFRKWLREHHAKEEELLVRCFKVHARALGMTYREAVDEALCYGWIDGVRRKVDEDSFSVRFSPRTRRSAWSQVNLRRVAELIEAKRMAKPGLAAYEGRDQTRTGLHSFERAAMTLTPALQRKLRAHRKAWSHFQGQPPWYRRTTVFWVMSAKKDETRLRRLDTLIACSAQGRRIGPLARE
jgi:uncharacterized protein YdeI (YjbR/CyaY-like superfamily)